MGYRHIVNQALAVRHLPLRLRMAPSTDHAKHQHVTTAFSLVEGTARTAGVELGSTPSVAPLAPLRPLRTARVHNTPLAPLRTFRTLIRSQQRIVN